MRKATPSSSLAAISPDLARQWHPTRNGDRRPDDFLPKSDAKAWWQCLEDPTHEWQATIGSRHVAGCPHCYRARRYRMVENHDGQRAIQKFSDVPELLAQVVATEDEKRQLADLYIGSSKLLTWQCAHGHPQWQSRLRKRTIYGHGCPYCSNQRTYPGNSLLARYPDLAEEWDQARNLAQGFSGTPETVNPGSHKHVWWRCTLGHGWRTEIRQRVTQQTGCPKCNPKTSKFEVRIGCELQTVFATKLERGQKVRGAEADILLPDLNVIVEVDGYPWHSPLHFPHSLERDIRKTRLFRSNGFIVLRLRETRLPAIEDCLSVLYDEGEDSLVACKAVVAAIAATHPAADDLRVRAQAYQHSSGYVADEAYRQIAATLHLPGPGESLKEWCPELCDQWCLDRNLPLTPELVKPGSNQRAWWQCSCGYIWQATINNRAKLQTGCPRCTGRVPSDGNTLADKFPAVAALWDTRLNDDAPDQISAFSNQERAWRCDRGHEWKAAVHNLTRGKQGCPYCAHKRPSSDWNLMYVFPAVAALFDDTKNAPLRPEEVLPRSGKAVWWKCNQGHSWRASPDRQTRYGPRCRQCAATIP